MSLPSTHDRIDCGNAGTNTSQSTIDDNRCQVLVRSAMYDKVVSNVKMNQEKSADPYTMDANAEPYNSNECDGLINSHENLCKNKAGKDNLTESREPTNKKQKGIS